MIDISGDCLSDIGCLPKQPISEFDQMYDLESTVGVDLAHSGERLNPELDDEDLRRTTMQVLCIYLAAVFVISSVLWAIVGVDPVESTPGKLVLLACSLLMTLAMNYLLLRSRWMSLGQKTAFAFVLASVVAPLYCVVDFVIYAVCVYPEPPVFDWQSAGYTLIFGLSLFFGWACLFVALLYSFDVRDSDRRLARIREEALSAQMRALRYQVNPHFLFNTLNSIAGLIEEDADRRAGQMVQSLSNFLRKSLTLDPMQDVSLGEELSVQQQYLEIERERFSDRMNVEIDVSDNSMRGLVPSFILQPLIENAIKHGVGATKGRVCIAIRGRRRKGRLVVEVENDMPLGAAKTQDRASTGIGLRNVAERIAARFQDDARLISGPCASGRFRVELDLPWKSA